MAAPSGRVQPPNGEVQHGGEADPGQIRHQQPAGDLRAAEEGHRRGHDRQQQDHNLHEGPARLVPLPLHVLLRIATRLCQKTARADNRHSLPESVQSSAGMPRIALVLLGPDHPAPFAPVQKPLLRCHPRRGNE